MPSQPVDNRRSCPRVSFDVDVGVNDTHNFYTGRTRDLSTGGIFIETPVALPPGSSVTVKLRIDGTPFTLACVVAWCLTDDSGEAAGFGAQFEQLPPTAKRAIDRYMKRRAPELFEQLSDDARIGPPPLPLQNA